MTDTPNETADTAPLPLQEASDQPAPETVAPAAAPAPVAADAGALETPAQAGGTVNIPTRWLLVGGGILLVFVLMAGSFSAGIFAGRHSLAGFRRGGIMMQAPGQLQAPGQQGDGYGQDQLPFGHPGRGFGGRGGQYHQRGMQRGAPQGMPWSQQSPDATATPQQ